jgi:hypothetical protein
VTHLVDPHGGSIYVTGYDYLKPPVGHAPDHLCFTAHRKGIKLIEKADLGGYDNVDRD